MNFVYSYGKQAVSASIQEGLEGIIISQFGRRVCQRGDFLDRFRFYGDIIWKKMAEAPEWNIDENFID